MKKNLSFPGRISALLFIIILLGSIIKLSAQKDELGTINNPALSGSHLKAIHPDQPGGLCWVDPDGPGDNEPFLAYTDTTGEQEGGWTLVLLSNASVTNCPRPYWTELTSTNNLNLNGTLSSDITAYDMFMNVSYWNLLGDSARLEMGASPSSLSHRAYYDFSLDENNNYALVMENEFIDIHTEGTASPGIYTYHNGRPLTTRDADHDAWSGNCSNNYFESAWWYGACMTGSFWGGGGESYQDAPYWTGLDSEYFEYGSIWLKEKWIAIENATDLQNMKNDLSANYYLVKNIDVSETATWNSNGSGGFFGFESIGTESNPFTGRFDGNGYCIKGLYINRPAADGVGLFGYYDGTDIRNVVIQNINIEGGNSNTGSLVGKLLGGKVSSCNAQGVISATGERVGGLIGTNLGGKILNSYATVATKGGNFTGGFVGDNQGTINKCYSMGPVEGSSGVGGFAGTDGGTVTNSFWDIRTSKIAISASGTGLDPAVMTSLSSFTNQSTSGLDEAWDFIGNSNDDAANMDIWSIDSSINRGYPYLTIQKTSGDIVYVKSNASGTEDGSSWENAYSHLQDALNSDQIWYGVNIWLGEGTYFPDDGSGYTSNDRDASFVIPDGLAIYGGFRGTESSLSERDPIMHPTILSGDIGTAGDSMDNTFHVIRGGHHIHLNGLTIEKGLANGESGIDMFGGGIYNAPGTKNILIEHCNFLDNTASAQGGAVYNNGYVTITTRHTNFYRNKAADNATVKNINTEADYYYCTFLENADGSMGGGLMYWGSGSGSPEIHNCSFIRNSSSQGGAIHLRAFGINADIKNCIFYHNSPDDIALTNGALANVSYSRIVQSPYAGKQNNIADEPMFSDTSYESLALYDVSPCIDAGDAASFPDPDGSRANMGDFHDLELSPIHPSFTVTPEVASCEVMMEFDASSTTSLPGHDVYSYEWDFDYNGTFEADTIGEVIRFKYERMNFSGSGQSITVLPYTVALKVTDSDTPPFTVTRKGEATLSFENHPPVADAGGIYYSTLIGDTPRSVRLDGSSSNDPDIPCDEIRRYLWDTDGDDVFGSDDTDGSPYTSGITDGEGETIEIVNPSWHTGDNHIVGLIVEDYYGARSSRNDVAIQVVDIRNFPADLYNVNVDALNRDTLWFTFTVSHPQEKIDTFSCSFSVSGIPVTAYDSSGKEITEIPYEGYDTERVYSAWFNSHELADMENAYKLKVSVSGNESAWVNNAQSELFGVDNTAPVNPASCHEPGSSDGICTDNPEPSFTWNGASDNLSATLEYQVYWGTDTGGKAPAISLINEQFTPDPLTENGVYYLRVNTKDEAGNEAGWTTLYSFVLIDYHTSTSESICEGDSILWRGAYYMEPGIYYDSLLTKGGCDSIFELELSVSPVYSSQETNTICEGETFNWQGTDYSIAGDYLKVYPAVSGCDSIITLHLNIQSVNLAVSVTENGLTSEAMDVDYQWLNCDSNYSEITGAIHQLFSPLFSGDYAVIIDDGICVDTTVCYPVTINTGINIPGKEKFQIYPNPFGQSTTIKFNNATGYNYDLYLLNLSGEIVRIIKDINTSEFLLKKTNLKEGIYFIELRGPEIFRGKIIIK